MERSWHLRPLGFDIERIDRLAGGHEQPIALHPAEADIGAFLRQQDLANAVAIGGKDLYTVKSVTSTACSGPDVAVDIAADAVGRTRGHVDKQTSARHAYPVHNVIDADHPRCRTAIDDVES